MAINNTQVARKLFITFFLEVTFIYESNKIMKKNENRGKRIFIFLKILNVTWNSIFVNYLSCIYNI